MNCNRYDEKSDKHGDPLCKLHPNKILDVYCEKDHKLICSTCLIHNHQHHKLTPVSSKAEKQRIKLKENISKIDESLKQYEKADLKAQADEVQVEHAFLDCQTEANLFFQTVAEEVSRLKSKEMQRLIGKKQESVKKLESYREQLKEQIHFLSQLLQMHEDLSLLGDGWFLLQSDKRNFIIDSCKHKQEKYSPPSLSFKKSICLQQISKSIQDMISLQHHRNSINTMSPSLKKQKQPAILEVNLREECHRRKGTSSYTNPKSKPAKKTISIIPQHIPQQEKVNYSMISQRRGNSGKKKSDVKQRSNSSRIEKGNGCQQLEDSFLSVDMSNSFIPISSVNSFMRSSRMTENDSLLDDTTLRNTFAQFSMLSNEQSIFHLGGLSQSYSEKYCYQTKLSQRLSSSNIQFKGKGFNSVKIKTQKGQKCLIVGNSVSKTPSIQVHEFNLKEERIFKSSLKITHARSSFNCLSKENCIYLIGGKIHEKAINNFDSYKHQGNQLIYFKMPNMIQARFDLGCCVGYDGHLYTLGGIGLSNDSLSTVQRFNFEKLAWQSIKPMRQSRINFTAVATPKGIFVIGGHTTKRFLKQVQYFDYEEKRWIDKGCMQVSRCYHTAILSKDYKTITVFGGFSENNMILDSIQIYSIDNNEWVVSSKMKEKRCLHVSVQK